MECRATEHLFTLAAASFICKSQIQSVIPVFSRFSLSLPLSLSIVQPLYLTRVSAEMDCSHNIKMAVTGKQRFDSDTKESAWSSRALCSLKSLMAMVFVSQPEPVTRDDDREPLLEEKQPYVPKHAASSFLKTATSRAMMRRNEMLRLR